MALHFASFLSIVLFKFLPHLKIIKNDKKLSVFGEDNSRCLFNFLQTHIFWNFDRISGTCNQINYRNISFAKVIILIMTAQVLLFDIFFKKEMHLNAAEQFLVIPAFVPLCKRKIMILTLPVSADIQTFVNQLLKQEILSSQNKWFCHSCSFLKHQRNLYYKLCSYISNPTLPIL